MAIGIITLKRDNFPVPQEFLIALTFPVPDGKIAYIMSSEPMPATPADAKTTVVIPTYNEAANLPALVGELLSLGVPGLTVLIVDDSSPDGTGQVADTLADRFPGIVKVRHRANKEGLGRAYVDGFGCALDDGADFIIQMDADFSHSPSVIPAMLAAIQTCDLVIGSRYVNGGQLDERWSWWRRFLSWWANEIWSRRILGLRTRDITAGFRCWRRATLLGIGLQTIQTNGYAFQVEMTYLAERLRYRIVETPIYFEDRRIGLSKMSVPVKLQGALDVLRMQRCHRHVTRQPIAHTAHA
jgi:dolichol-phosphate mannosyltransferase